jgi:hypothetical protein
MKSMEERYLIKERAEADVGTYGSVEKAIQSLESELEEMESLWGMYSSECLGHGITCTSLKISWLKNKT